jgi:hypothetical protein
MLPWWVGSTLAVVAYVVLHRYASADVPTNVSPGQVGQMVVGQMTKVLAFYGQFIVPLLLLAGAAASFFGRRKREGLVRDAGGDKSGATLRALNWKDFELLVGEAFRMRGFSVVETGGGGSDGGIDLQLKKGSEVFLVQCKQWRAYKVSVNVVRLSTECAGNPVGKRWTNGGKLPSTGLRQGKLSAAQELGVASTEQGSASGRSGSVDDVLSQCSKACGTTGAVRGADGRIEPSRGRSSPQNALCSGDYSP